MSQYQYYEFFAIDRPLMSKEMSALRALSTRAHIIPISFTNEYNWGDFKGDPDKLMQRFFDAHVYVANWMTAVGRKGMSYTEEDWIDEDASSHRGPDD